MSAAPQSHSSFRFLRQQTIASLNIHIQQYQHISTGALHIHLSSEQTENVFLVALKTMPQDSSGVAHVLEHTALCGSEKFPVRDPFFMMIRRSLNTFMNAFTSSDWTAYPFASQNKKDFNNLLEVYLDAVFFARLDALDFAQEGHRVEFSESNNSTPSLEYKGVVFNEMKGAMSSPVSQLWQTLTKYLFPSTTYHFNSGGEPADIPDLTHEQLLAFYQRHYHPSNAIFMTSGDISAATHQESFEKHALHRFSEQKIDLFVADEKRYFSPLKIQESYPCAANDEHAKSHLVLGWLLGHSTDLKQQMQANLLSRVLLDNSASPLRKELETCGIGTGPSPLCGLEDSNKEMTFVCGLEGAEPADAEQFETLVMNCLKKVVDDGVAQSEVEAALHQLELGQREIGGDGYPFGMQLILSALPAAIHGGDALAALNLDPVLAELAEGIKNRHFIPNLIQELLLDNVHQVRLTLAPDEQMSARKDAAEQLRLKVMLAAMNDDQRKTVIDNTQALLERQSQEDDANILPEVTRDDIPVSQFIASPTISNKDLGWEFYAAGTNGLVYHQLVIDLPKVEEKDLPYINLLAQLMTELGMGEQDYLSVQAQQAAVCGSLSAYLSYRGQAADADHLNAYFIVSTKGLITQQTAIVDLLKQTLMTVRFDEHQRIKELVGQLRSRRQQSVGQSGHSFALGAASRNMCAGANLQYQVSGLQGVVWLQNLDDGLAQEQNLIDLCAKLTALHQQLCSQSLQLASVGEEQQQNHIQKTFTKAFIDQVGELKGRLPWQYTPFDGIADSKPVQQMWTTNTQVNYCARSFPTVPSAHPDAATLVVLGEVLRNGFLHRAVREQGGAYGGGAGQDNNNACFRFYSYRDPRSAETFADFSASVDWVLSDKLTEQHLEEAVLGVIGSLDKPSSPAGEALQAYQNQLHGRSPAIRQAFRASILAVDLNGLQRVAKDYLQGVKPSEAVVAPAELSKHAYFSDFEVYKV
ncbi:MAG: insulinase family protein [Gammaproteobacteria bacterium]|nr:insulinase family protein [Gammaproteobacteria bacterium]